MVDLMRSEPAGQMTPSVYETARLVSLAPWLPGHDRRLQFVSRALRPDGLWECRDGYALVPGLSAVEALLACVARDGPHAPGHTRTVPAAVDGLNALRPVLETVSGAALPDTVAAEVIVPGLVARINERVTALRTAFPRLDIAPLPVSAGTGAAERPRAGVGGKNTHPAKLLHTLEILDGHRPTTVRVTGGCVGCSPAATAAWLGSGTATSAGPDPARYFADLDARYGGPVPSVTPITVFERAWVLAALQEAGADLVSLAPDLLDELEDVIADGPAPGAPGLPPDADTSGVVLTVLAHAGRVRAPGVLDEFHNGRYFHCWTGERTPSPTANAHAIQALGAYLHHRPSAAARYGPVLDETVRWLVHTQTPQGCWTDKWHSSAYYATWCCATALARHGGPSGRAAAYRAARWVTRTRGEDGGWGRWQQTSEETAYAVATLALFGTSPAIDSGAAFLHRRAADTTRPRSGHPPLWHDKDLYAPTLVVDAAIAAALALARRTARPAGPDAGTVS